MPRVVVHLRRRDLLRAQFQMIRRMPFFKLLFVALLASNTWYWYRTTPPTGILGAVIAIGTALLLTAAVMFVVFVIAAALMLNRLRSTPGVLGEHRFEITEEGLREVTEVSEIRVAFGSARKVFRTRSFLVALIHSRGAFVFPRRAFADSSAYDEFWNALQPLAGKKNS
jgi:hypothetical protein